MSRSTLNDEEPSRLVLAIPGWAGVRVPISVVVPSSRQMPLRVRALIDLLVEEFPRLGLGPRAEPKPPHPRASPGISGRGSM